MADFKRRSAVLDEPAERRSRFGDLGDRLTRGFSKPDQRQSRQKPRPQLDHALEPPPPVPEPDWDQDQPTEDEPMPRFPITRQGYDCAAVDEHIAELEQELMDLDREVAEMRTKSSSKSDVAAEMERIGEQTSAILIAAHEQAKETTRRAQEEADRCIADAAQNAVETTASAQRELRALEGEKLSLARERERLLEDIRNVAASLTSLAEDANDRFPSNEGFPHSHERVGPITAAAMPHAADPQDHASRDERLPESVDQPTVVDLHEA